MLLIKNGIRMTRIKGIAVVFCRVISVVSPLSDYLSNLRAIQNLGFRDK